MGGFLGCTRTLLGHVHLVVHHHPQVILLRAALNHFVLQLVLTLEIFPTQVQDLEYGLVKCDELHRDPLLELLRVVLDSIPSLSHVNHTTQLGVICKFAEGALGPCY